jgi:hypothetical protein
VNGDGFGDVVVGVPYNTLDDPGRVWLFHGATTGLSSTPSWAFRASADRIRLGWSVASAGDVNGDGFDDVIAGGPQTSTLGVEPRIGFAEVFLGSAGGLGASPSWEGSWERDDDGYGKAVSSAGDVDGDGFDDVAVGAPDHDHGGLRNAGRVFVYGGAAAGPDASAGWILDRDEEDERFGTAVAAADVNADGYSDLVVGAPTDGGPGRAYLFLGSASGLGSSETWTAEESAGGAEFGLAVAAGSDVDGDGHVDVIVGSEWEQGNAFVYLGGSDGLTPEAAWLLRPELDHPESRFGVALAMGDANGDGFGDVLVGAPNATHGETFEGRAYLWLGAGTLDSDADGIPDESIRR